MNRNFKSPTSLTSPTITFLWSKYDHYSNNNEGLNTVIDWGCSSGSSISRWVSLGVVNWLLITGR